MLICSSCKKEQHYRGFDINTCEFCGQSGVLIPLNYYTAYVVGNKYDDNKPQWHLLPLEEVETVVKVLTLGAKKYSPDNWKQVPDAKNRYFSAAMRHLTAWKSGELHDKESGLYHLAHAICCLLFLMWFDNKVKNEPRNTTKE